MSTATMRCAGHWRASTVSTSSPTGSRSPTLSSPLLGPPYPPRSLAAIRDMIDHIRRFNERLLERRGDWRFESDPGLVVGEKVTAIASAGLFCPSGKASYPSVLAQLGTPAVVAGVRDIAVVVPPKPGAGGAVDPVVLVVAEELGLRTVFRVERSVRHRRARVRHGAAPEGGEGGRAR